MLESPEGISANELRRVIGGSYKTAWFVAHRIRTAMAGRGAELLRSLVEAESGHLGGLTSAADPFWDDVAAAGSLDPNETTVMTRMRRLVAGPHHGLSTKYLHAYIDERRWRSTHRDNPHVFRDTIIALLQGEGISLSDWSPPGSPVPAGRGLAPLRPRDGRGGEPALVALPQPRRHRRTAVRLRLPDRPGASPRSRPLAAHGLNVLRLEVLDRESGWVVDDFLVAGRTSVRPRPACRRRRGARLPAGVDLRDPGWRWLRRVPRSPLPRASGGPPRARARGARAGLRRGGFPLPPAGGRFLVPSRRPFRACP
jgi:hypothetical protein